MSTGEKYEPVLLDNAYKVHMKLTIRSVGPTDFGSYKCVSKNSLGDTDGSIKLYREYCTVCYHAIRMGPPQERQSDRNEQNTGNFTLTYVYSKRIL